MSFVMALLDVGDPAQKHAKGALFTLATRLCLVEASLSTSSSSLQTCSVATCALSLAAASRPLQLFPWLPWCTWRQGVRRVRVPTFALGSASASDASKFAIVVVLDWCRSHLAVAARAAIASSLSVDN